MAELLRNGVTTFIEFGSQERVQDALLAEVTRLGTRAYLAPGYDCGRWVGDEKGRLKRVRNDELGLDGLATALHGSNDTTARREGRVRGILVPREVETVERRASSPHPRGGGRAQAADGDARGLQRARVPRCRARAHEDADRAAG